MRYFDGVAPVKSGGSTFRRFLRRLKHWAREPNERYLAEATDLADLERRMRSLERASGGPAFRTFIHPGPGP